MFAVESHGAQLVRRPGDSPGPEVVRVLDRDGRVLSEGPGSPTIDLDGLAPDRTVNLRVEDGRRTPVRFRTLPDVGTPVTRVATVSDVHLGQETFGFRARMLDRSGDHARLHGLRAAEAALAEAAAWGAETIVIKGDLVDRSTAAAWHLARELLHAVPIPVHLLPGNHELNQRGQLDARRGAEAVGLRLVDGAERIDLGVTSVLLVETAEPIVHHGSVRPDVLAKATELAAGSPNPLLVLTHHPIERFDLAWSYPPGIPRSEGEDFLRSLTEVALVWMLSGGHTHSHRRRTISGVVTSEVGGPKDFPGTWAGYEIGPLGCRQVVRHVADRAVTPWLDRTAGAVAGIWGLWAPGRLADRCFVVREPTGATPQ